MNRDDRETKYNAHSARPFVGYVSSGNTIEMLTEGGNFVCRQTASSGLLMGFVIVMIATCAVAGSQSSEARRLKHFMDFPLSEQIGHVVIGLLILGLVGAALFFAIEKLLFFGTLVVDSGGVLRFCNGLNHQETRVVRPGEIRGLRLSQVSFRGKRVTHVNYILIVQLQTGEEIVLCTSTEQAMVVNIQAEIARRTGVRLDACE